MIHYVILYSITTQLFAIGKIAAIVYIHLNGWRNSILCLSYSCSYLFRYFLQRCEPNRLKMCMDVICNSVQESCLTSSLPSYSFTPLTIRSLKRGCPCKAADQPLFCSVGTACHLHHQHCLNWCTCALWSGLCSHALLLPGCVFLDDSRSHPITQEVGDCVQTKHHQLCHHCHGNMLG